MLSIPGRSHENRYFSLLADALEDEGVTIVPPTARATATLQFDILHLNFPTHYITENGAAKAWAASAAFAAFLLLSKLTGRKIVYTVHDVVPFRRRHPFLLDRFLRLVHRLSDAFVFISMSSRDAFVATYPGDATRPWLLVLHGPYPSLRIAEAERPAQRRLLLGRDDSFAVGYLGSIKPYKNIAALSGLPATLPDGRVVQVVVAGRSEGGHEEAVAGVLRGFPTDRLVRLDHRLDDDELDRLIQLTDIVLLPYRMGSNSGVALLVLGNGGRIIGSDLPVFRELATTIGPPWAYSCDTGNSAQLAGAVIRAATEPVTGSDRQALDAYLRNVGYDQSAAALSELYEKLVIKSI